MLAGQRLRRAATYAADRALLRRLIEQVPEAVEPTPAADALVPPVEQPETAAPALAEAPPAAKELPIEETPVAAETPAPPSPVAAAPIRTEPITTEPQPSAPSVPLVTAPAPVPVGNGSRARHYARRVGRSAGTGYSARRNDACRP